MRRWIAGIMLGALVGLGTAGTAAAEEVVKDTMTMRAKDSVARTVNIGGELFHVTTSTKMVGPRGKPLSFSQLPVPEVRGAVPPASEPGVLVKYAAIAKPGSKDLLTLDVFRKGPRSH